MTTTSNDNQEKGQMESKDSMKFVRPSSHFSGSLVNLSEPIRPSSSKEVRGFKAPVSVASEGTSDLAIHCNQLALPVEVTTLKTFHSKRSFSKLRPIVVGRILPLEKCYNFTRFIRLLVTCWVIRLFLLWNVVETVFFWCREPVCGSQLNGSHGEVTESDDVKSQSVVKSIAEATRSFVHAPFWTIKGMFTFAVAFFLYFTYMHLFTALWAVACWVLCSTVHSVVRTCILFFQWSVGRPIQRQMNKLRHDVRMVFQNWWYGDGVYPAFRHLCFDQFRLLVLLYRSPHLYIYERVILPFYVLGSLAICFVYHFTLYLLGYVVREGPVPPPPVTALVLVNREEYLVEEIDTDDEGGGLWDELNGAHGEVTEDDDLEIEDYFVLFIMLTTGFYLYFRMLVIISIQSTWLFVTYVYPNFTSINQVLFICCVVHFLKKLDIIPTFEDNEPIDDPHSVPEVPMGRGRRFYGQGARRAVLNNRGTGGKSKVPRGPEPDPDGIAEAQKVGARLDEEEDDLDEPDPYYVFSDFPNTQTLFFYDELYVGGAIRNFVKFQAHGTPFCGPTCIDLAIKELPDIEVYDSMLKCLDLVEIGSDTFLEKYANARGVNLAISYTNEEDVEVLQIYKNNPRWKYVVLRYDPVLTEEGEVFEEDGQEVGHYTLMVSEKANKINIVVSGYVNQVHPFSIIPTLRNNYVYLREELNSSDDEVRTYNERRDKIEEQDRYSVLGVSTHMVWCGVALDFGTQGLVTFNDWAMGHLTVQVRRVLDYFVPVERPLTPDVVEENLLQNRVTACIEIARVSINGYIHDPILAEFLAHFNYRTITISNARTEACLREAQLLPVEHRSKALTVIGRLKGLNTDCNLPGVLFNTTRFCQDMIDSMGDFYASRARIDVGLNPNNMTSIIPNLEIIKENQENGMVGLGNNHVRGAKLKTVKINKPVAFAPTITIATAVQQLGPGPLCLTDDAGLLAAFCGRSMSYPGKQDLKVVKEFSAFAEEEITHFLKSVELAHLGELRPEEFFREHYRGKRPVTWIEQVLNNHAKAKSKMHVTNKFFKNSCFVKFENSSKIKDGKVRVRPRLIMVMSDFMMVEYCQVLRVIDAWNHSDFAQYQVKGMSFEDFVAKVEKLTNREHMVTDYSSFEASIIGEIRKVENSVIRQLLQRAGFNETLKIFEEFVVPKRVMHSSAGVFVSDSRNSGDFHTSFGNGFINVLLSKFVHHKTNPEKPFSMIAEGDDGIISKDDCEPSILCNLGFSFSSALSGNYAGDVDFLRCRWVDGKRYLNVGRALKIVWVTTTKAYNKSTLRTIQRCAAYSLYLASPGHPVLSALVQRIGRETSGHTMNNKVRRYFKSWYNFDERAFEIKNFPKIVQVDESMRALIAQGAEGFPPIPLQTQLAMEDTFLYDAEPNIGSMMDHYEDVTALVDYTDWQQATTVLERSSEFQSLIDNLGVVCEQHALISM